MAVHGGGFCFPGDSPCAQILLFPLAMAAVPHPEEVWVKSIVTEKDLLRMVDDKVLLEKSLIGWRAADGELFPTANTGELVIFEPFFYRGFLLPTNKFFRGLLHFYGIELVHLNPNSILQIAAFIHLCEAFLGVEPHFALFRHLLTLRPLQKGGKTCVVGGATLQLRYGRANKYLGLALKASLKGWYSRWFYIANPDPSLPAYIGRRPKQRA